MYCELNDITRYLPLAELVQLLNDDNADYEDIDLSDTDTPAGGLLNNIINSAGEEVNGYLRGKYTVPLSPVPARIIDITAIIVVYRCFQRRIVSIPETIQTAQEEAINYLRDIRRGLVELDIDPPATESGFILSKNVYREFPDDLWSGN